MTTIGGGQTTFWLLRTALDRADWTFSLRWFCSPSFAPADLRGPMQEFWWDPAREVFQERFGGAR